NAVRVRNSRRGVAGCMRRYRTAATRTINRQYRRPSPSSSSSSSSSSLVREHARKRDEDEDENDDDDVRYFAEAVFTRGCHLDSKSARMRVASALALSNSVARAAASASALIFDCFAAWTMAGAFSRRSASCLAPSAWDFLRSARVFSAGAIFSSASF